MKNAVNRHKTLGTGVVIAIVGAAQMGMEQLRPFVPEKAFAFLTFGLGLLVAGIGAWNTMKEKQARDAAASQATGETP